MTDVAGRSRVQGGVPSGGQFAAETRGENGALVQSFPVVGDPVKERVHRLEMSEAVAGVPHVGPVHVTMRTWETGQGRWPYTTCVSTFYVQVDASPECDGTAWSGAKDLADEDRNRLLAETGLDQDVAFSAKVVRHDAWSKHDTPDVDDPDTAFSGDEETVRRVLIDGLDMTSARFHSTLRSKGYADRWDSRSPAEFDDILGARSHPETHGQDEATAWVERNQARREQGLFD